MCFLDKNGVLGSLEVLSLIEQQEMKFPSITKSMC